MRHSQRLALLALSLGIALLASAVSAQTFPAGSGTFSSRGKFKVRGCTKVRPLSGSVINTLDATGVLTEGPGEDQPIVGTLTPVGSSGRVFSTGYDAENRAIINGFMAEAASLVCGETFTLTTSQISATFKLNKRGTRATIRQRLTFSGTTSSRSHTGKYKSKDRAVWIPAS